uniref:Uncharacterized protein n=1 Tax=Rhizophora mucronata TaxID=61149 RepID=A0A2P2LHE1_RHIMU
MVCYSDYHEVIWFVFLSLGFETWKGRRMIYLLRIKDGHLVPVAVLFSIPRKNKPTTLDDKWRKGCKRSLAWRGKCLDVANIDD